LRTGGAAPRSDPDRLWIGPLFAPARHRPVTAACGLSGS